jgi:hypothetical protein
VRVGGGVVARGRGRGVVLLWLVGVARELVGGTESEMSLFLPLFFWGFACPYFGSLQGAMHFHPPSGSVGWDGMGWDGN